MTSLTVHARMQSIRFYLVEIIWYYLVQEELANTRSKSLLVITTV
jgi:hypothetical protein